MGEIVRLVLVELANNCWIFKGKIPLRLRIRNEFLTKYVSEIEAQYPRAHSITKLILSEFGILNPSIDDCEIVRYVCESVSTRSARFLGSVVAALILRINDDDITIGVDG